MASRDLALLTGRSPMQLRFKRNRDVVGREDVIGLFGIVGGGYFQTELKKLQLEIVQFDSALGAERGLGKDGKPLPVSAEQEAWWSSSWVPFFAAWRDFYENYAYGWKSINFPISQSRVEQLEEFRSQFIQLRAKALTLYPSGVAVRNLPLPSPPKTYPGFLDTIGDVLKSAILWLILGVGALGIIYVLVRK